MLVLLTGPVSRVSADFIGYGLTITASNEEGTGTFTLPFGDNLHSPMPITSDDPSHTVLGYLDETNISYDGDPLVNLSLSVTAGASNTTFTMNSAIVTFAPLLNPSGIALVSGGTLTDHNDNSVTMTGLFPGGTIYEADYNVLTTPVDWANLVTTTTVGPSGTFSGRKPTSGSQLIVDTVRSIQSHFAFTLSAGDSASASSTFNVSGGTVVPEPSTLMLFGLGTVMCFAAAVRKRFRRS